MAKPAASARSAPDPAAVLTKAMLRSAELLGLNQASLARIVGLSVSQVSRMAGGEKLLDMRSKPGELAALLVRVYRSLDALVGNDEQQRKAWMAGFNRQFNAAPREAIQTVDGLVRVVSYLDGARAPS